MSKNPAAQTENKMGVMPVNKLLITMSLPMMVSMLVMALYNIVDSIFVSWICEDALTAVSMAFPMQNLLIGVGSGLGVGTNALISRALGAKEHEAANRTAVQGLFLTAIGYLIFLVLGFTFAREFFILQGASDVIADYGQSYLSIVMIFSFGSFIQMIFERLLQSTGKTIYTMITQTLGAVINIILDPVLIFGYFGLPALGIAGAAIATIIGQIIAGILAFYFNMKHNEDVHISLAGFRPDGQIIGNILKIGVPSVVMVAIGSCMTFSVNKILVVFTSTAVAVFGVYFKLQSFAFMPIFGMNNGMVPIVAYNYGAKKPDRMMKALKLSALYAEIIMLAYLAIVQLFPDKMLGLFSASDQMLALGIPALRIISICFIFAGFSVISGSYFQSLGFSVYSMLVSFFRQLVFLVPMVYFFSKTGNIRLVWSAWPIAELVAVGLCIFFHLKIRKKILIPLREEIAGESEK